MPGKRNGSGPQGLPGDERQRQERRARLYRRLRYGSLAAVGWAALLVLAGPSRSGSEVPPAGVARQDLQAPFDYEENQPVADYQARVDMAVASVPVHYAFDADLVKRRIAALHDAFRLVRPRYRLYVADRDRLTAAVSVAAQPPAATAGSAQDRHAAPRPKADEVHPQPTPDQQALQHLERTLEDEMTRLRPEFVALVAVRRGEFGPDAFAALLKAGFAEELELLLADVAQVVLSARIVRDPDRFDDDLGRGAWDIAAERRYDRRNLPEVLSIDEAVRRSDQVLGEFVRQKGPGLLADPPLQVALKAAARSLVEPTFARDGAATRAAEQAARAKVDRLRTVRFAKGDVIVRRGATVTPELRALFARMWQGHAPTVNVTSFVATGVLLLLAFGLFVSFARRHLHHFRHRPRDAALLVGILLVHAAVLRAIVALAPALAELHETLSAGLLLAALPHALGPSLASLFVRPLTAAPFTLLCATVAGLMVHNAPLGTTDGGLVATTSVAALVLGLAGVHAARQFRQRSDLVWGAAVTSAAGGVTAAAFGLMTGEPSADLVDARLLWLTGLGFASGLLCYLLLSALTPVFESVFNRLTDIKLVELASMNHPALRLLATEAPGTFTHSVMVGNLAQAACDAIGANGLLARVGAYYHDLGKTKAPRYFAENQAGENPHDKLKPHLSALIIRAHVKDGIRILQDYRLPDEIIDFVPQHHGTSLIAHFYHRALREAQASGEDVNEADFRYPGPKPQRRETAILMLADAVEAAAKALPEPNPLRIAVLVKKIVAGKLEDGQFEECDLTLRELALAESAFARTLVGIHHIRPVYAPPVAPSGRQEAVATGDKERDRDDLKRVAYLADGGVGTRNRPTVSNDPAQKQHVEGMTLAAAQPLVKPDERDLPS
ncbi:MAG: HDIG domain-containing protein [Deltaproteobacteria bacterium]|nr:HDIG domain-containing protein [Deltaproteobacteria bacterium]